jgi:FHS family L-fucose permease-like MFS transporter
MTLRAAFSLVLVLFFSWGFLTALNDVLVTDFRTLFALSYRSATLVQFTFFLSCFVASFPCGSLVGRLGHKSTMLAGLAVMGLGALCFVAASTTPHFSTFLLAIVVMACGSTALQTAAGPYVSLMRPDASGASQFSLALAVNSMGAMLAPAFGAIFLLRRTANLDPHSLGPPFAAIAAGLLGLCILVARSRLPPLAGNIASSEGSSYAWLLRQPRFVFGLGAMLLYVGAEIAIGSLLINFLGQRVILSMPASSAAWLTSTYWAGSMVGRLLGWSLLKRLSPSKVLGGVATSATLLVLSAVLLSGWAAAICLLAVGLMNSVMVPILYNLSIADLGPNTGKGAGMLVGALIGGAAIPFAQGALADRIGLHHSFVLPALCYLVIATYAAAVPRCGPSGNKA